MIDPIHRNDFVILSQPTDESCGPTCLQGVYNYFGDEIDLDFLIHDVKKLKDGGTLAVMLGNHALHRGYEATIYTYNLQVFDPSWFKKGVDLSEKLSLQVAAKTSKRLEQATKAYLEYLKSGGKILFEELRPSLIRGVLAKKLPILTGLSATYLYKTATEIPETNAYDDIAGSPSGHFVVICGYDKETRHAHIADPLSPNPMYDTKQYYSVDVQTLINAILLGIVTYDANILVIQPK